MNAKAKSNSVITTLWVNAEGEATISPLGAVGVRFTAVGAGHRDLDLRKVSDTVARQFQLHGATQRVSDRAAISRDETTGRPATPEEKLAAMAALIDHYESGTEQWGMRISGERTIDGGLLKQALLAMYEGRKTAEQISAHLKTLSATQQKQLLNSDKVRPFADAIRAELAKGVDTEELLAGLEGLED